MMSLRCSASTGFLILNPRIRPAYPQGPGSAGRFLHGGRAVSTKFTLGLRGDQSVDRAGMEEGSKLCRLTSCFESSPSGHFSSTERRKEWAPGRGVGS